MDLYTEIMDAYPELEIAHFAPFTGVINLRDDGDGRGAYIAKWEYSKPIPDGLTLGKPNAQYCGKTLQSRSAASGANR